MGCPRRQRCAGKPLAVCLARNKGPRVFAWRQDDFLVLLPVQPLTRARSRSVSPSHAKDAPTDAALQRAWLGPHRDLQPLTPQRPTRRALAPRVAHRRRVGGDTGRLTHRLTRTLENSFPQALHWLQDQDTLLFGDCGQAHPQSGATRAPLDPGDLLASPTGARQTLWHSASMPSRLPLDARCGPHRPPGPARRPSSVHAVSPGT